MMRSKQQQGPLIGFVFGAAAATGVLVLLRFLAGDSQIMQVDAGGWSVLLWHVPIAAVAGALFGGTARSIALRKTARVIVAFVILVAAASGLVSTIVGSSFPGPGTDPLFDERSLAGAAIDFILYSMAFFILAVPEAVITVFGTRLVASTRR